jgi:hypothetical protein
MVSAVLSRTDRKVRTKKDLLTVKELTAELRMSPKSIQRAYRKWEMPVQLFLCSLVVAPGYI